MLNAGDTMLEYKSSLLQCHPDTHDATYMLASVSYFEPGLSEKLPLKGHIKYKKV